MKKTTRSDEAHTALTGTLNTFANIVSLLFSVVFVPITSRILSAADLGRAVSFITTREILFVIVSLSVAQSVSLAMIDFREEKKRYLSSVFLFVSLCVGGIFAVSLLFRRSLIPLFFGSEFLFYWLFAVLICQAALEILTNYVNFHNRHIISFFIVLLTGPLPLLVSTALVLRMETDKYIGRIVGMDSFFFGAGLLSAVVILVVGRCAFRLSHVRYALRLTAPLVPYMLATMVLVRSDIMAIAHFEGDDKAGIYTMAFTGANILFAVLQQICRSWSPWVYRKLDAGETEIVHRSTRHLVFFAFLAGVGLMCVSPEFVRLFLGREYADSVLLICPIMAGMFLRFLSQLFYDVEYFHKQNRFIAIASAAVALLSIALKIWLIVPFGYEVCAVVTALCYGLLILAQAVHMRRIERRAVYDLRQIFLGAGIFLLLSMGLRFAVELWVLRYGILLAATGICLYLERAHLPEWKRLIVSRLQRRHKGS